MSYRVAIVTADRVTIGNHFARAEAFAIYSVRDDFTYVHEEDRRPPAEDADPTVACDCHEPAGIATCGPSQHCGVEAAASDGSGSVGYALGGGGCGSGGGCGCGSGGCGGGGGGGDGPIDPRLEKTAAALADVQIVIAGSVGPQALAALSRRGIRAFAVGGSVTKALDKLVGFERRQHERFGARARA
ncbi:MAG TPA: NifB/NifX family molybdenum-iron cluster-binding protein [Polyangiaceae bacterium]|nr:NifB/NifX family molybdenum-iron cluster-binding protein [Polyangiaceae bacterium]